MAGSRIPGPIERTTPSESESRECGPGAFTSCLPVGKQETPLNQPAPSNSQSAATGIELNLVGSYPKPAAWTAAKEKQLIGNDTWFPHTADFLAVAGKGSLEITTPEDFLLKIVEAKGAIARLNFFSHGVTGRIATSGTVDPAGQFCTLDTGWTAVIGSKRIADPYAKYWGDDGENSGSAPITVGNKTFTLDAIRAKFTKDSQIWLYICHGGADPTLLQNLSNTFQAKVRAFTKVVVYCAPANFPTSLKHRVNVMTGTKPSDSCPTAVSDFRQLTSDIGASPKKP